MSAARRFELGQGQDEPERPCFVLRVREYAVDADAQDPWELVWREHDGRDQTILMTFDNTNDLADEICCLIKRRTRQTPEAKP